jgi:hypothetical protein
LVFIPARILFARDIYGAFPLDRRFFRLYSMGFTAWVATSWLCGFNGWDDTTVFPTQIFWMGHNSIFFIFLDSYLCFSQ